MARRRRPQQTQSGGFAKPILGLVLIGLMYVAFQAGMFKSVGTLLMAPLAPQH